MMLLLILIGAVFCIQTEAQATNFDKAFSQAGVKVGRWHMQSNPLVNLHQRLLYQTRFSDEKPSVIAGDDLIKWNHAVADYRAFVGKRDPITDDELVRMNAALSAATGFSAPKDIPRTAAKILDAIMPVYRKAQWAEDNRINRFCMSVAAPMLEAAGEELVAAHEKAYEMPFPKHILVDFAALGWQFGAYTVGDEDHAHVVMQSQNNPAAEGLMILESMIHEPSHVLVGSTSGAIGGDLTRISKELGIRPYANLWHAILFYTAGELTRRAFAHQGVLDYKPIILQMYAGPFKGFRNSLEKHWQAFLDGKMSRDDALRQIIIETAPPKRPVN
jgi:hypothetical protein